MIVQYLEMKKQYQDCLLFFRVGDFYEMYFDDAVVAARDMDVVLTSKGCGDNEKSPMCGVPYHSVEVYIARLLAHGHKVAVAEQMEDPATAKGIVAREVIRIITPGTVISQNMLDEKKNNFLASVWLDEDRAGLAWADISTGEFAAVSLSGSSLQGKLLGQLAAIDPRELIINRGPEEAPYIWELADQGGDLYISDPAGRIFSDEACADRIEEHFSTSEPASVGLSRLDRPELFHSVGALLGYLKETQKQDVLHLEKLDIRETGSAMSLDRSTIRNLEITETLFERRTQGSLFGLLDLCGTAMGSRRLKQWLTAPLTELSEIKKRHMSVEKLADDILLRNDLKSSLKAVYDLERLCGRISLGTANARDLLALKQSLACLPDIKSRLLDADDPLLSSLSAEIDPLTELYGEISAAVSEDAPFSVREGGMIMPGYSEELDALTEGSREAREWISGLEASERARTGIKGLKVRYNKVFGYSIEVPNSSRDQVPEDYIRKQTLVNAERFITSELKEKEDLVMNARLKINDLEYRIFSELRLRAVDHISSIKRSSAAVASCDVLVSFAECAVRYGYVRPEMTDGDEIVIIRGRHPVIENTIRDGIYVSNDVYLNRKDASMLLITGPNMSGKSTYMRQVALTVLMAQAGSFVPADSAVIGVCDRIYTRIGASDNLAMGQSTFFVEMSELAYILNTASPRSLVILDEIGRGTSTYDGLSIAWAAVDFLTDPALMARTLFATHYHELTALAGRVPGVRNLNVEVSEENGNILFLHKIVEGSASRSYGIHVARLAGVPRKLLEDAEEKLAALEDGAGAAAAVEESLDGGYASVRETALSPAKGRTSPGESPEAEPADGVQLSFITDRGSALIEKIRSIDLMEITPSMAIRLIEELKEEADR